MVEVLLKLSYWTIPVFLLIVLGAGIKQKVPMYEVFVQGAMDGIKTTIKLTPYILAIFVAVGIFRTSGALDNAVKLLHPLLQLIGIHPDLLTLGLLKPLSGSASMGITAELLSKFGPDSNLGITASIIQGSSETTFYVYSLYLGSVNIKDSRHILATGLVCEAVALILALLLGPTITRP